MTRVTYKCRARHREHYKRPVPRAIARDAKFTEFIFLCNQRNAPESRAAKKSVKNNQNAFEETMGSNGKDSQTVTAEGLADLLRTALRTLKAGRRDFVQVVTELNTAKLVGEGGIFERGQNVPVTHMEYFMPPADELLDDLKAKDRRSAK